MKLNPHAQTFHSLRYQGFVPASRVVHVQLGKWSEFDEYKTSTLSSQMYYYTNKYGIQRIELFAGIHIPPNDTRLTHILSVKNQ